MPAPGADTRMLVCGTIPFNKDTQEAPTPAFLALAHMRGRSRTAFWKLIACRNRRRFGHLATAGKLSSRFEPRCALHVRLLLARGAVRGFLSDSFSAPRGVIAAPRHQWPGPGASMGCVLLHR